MSRARRNLSLILALLLLALVGGWIHNGVRKSLQESRVADLQAALDAQVSALELWIEHTRAETRRWAEDPRIEGPVRQLAGLARAAGTADGGRLRQSAAQDALRQVLEPVVGQDDVAGYYVAERGGVLLASSEPDYLGLALRPETFLPPLGEVFAGKSVFLHPYREQDRIAGARAPDARARAWAQAPVRDADGRVVAALGFGRYADGRFAGILGAVRVGRTGEAYAFDDSGLLLSESRFAAELEAIGLIPKSARGSAVLNLELRDPGGDMSRGYRPGADLGAQPLTRLVAVAAASRHKAQRAEQRGVLLEPYRNYRGAEVIGAWRWLADHHLGVAIEVEAAEAFAPLRYVNIGFGVVVGAVFLVWGGFWLASFPFTRAARRRSGLRRLGPYALEKQVGEGGMGKIFLARHALLKRPTAVKMLKPHIATDEMIARFEREVQLASQLSHPNTVDIWDYGRTSEGVFYYAMEYLTGISLDRLVEIDEQVPVARALHILRQMLEALREAHQRSMVHRDVKPENIMLCYRGGQFDVIKVLDFGLVKTLDGSETRDITRYIRVLGTPLYMAPERIRNPGDVDARADIYAVGAVGYYLLTGRRMFEYANDDELREQVLGVMPAPPSACGVSLPAELERLVMACLAKDREQRPASAEAVIEVLERLSLQLPWTQRDARAWWEAHPNEMLADEGL